MAKRCRHARTSTIWHQVEGANAIAVARRCTKCRVRLSLGPSNDAMDEVQVEIRAVELLAKIVKVKQFSSEQFGWEDHVDCGYDPLATDMDSIGYLSGWLARELATYDDRETRDADAWAWDPSRPVAWQYEEQLASSARGLAELERLQRVREERAAIAGMTARRHSDLQDAKDVSATRIPGRVPYAEDRLKLPAVPPIPFDDLIARHNEACDAGEDRLPLPGRIEVELVDADPDADPPPVVLDAACEAERAEDPDCRDEDDVHVWSDVVATLSSSHEQSTVGPDVEVPWSWSKP